MGEIGYVPFWTLIIILDGREEGRRRYEEKGKDGRRGRGNDGGGGMKGDGMEKGGDLFELFEKVDVPRKS